MIIKSTNTIEYLEQDLMPFLKEES